jgi:hypothetical protein
VYVRDGISGDFTLVYDQDQLGLPSPPGDHVMVGLSYSTGPRQSRFFLSKFEVNCPLNPIPFTSNLDKKTLLCLGPVA